MAFQTSNEPCYAISIVARMVRLHPQTLRAYERIGLVVPARSSGNVRLYSHADVERLQKICRLTEELGINLSGVDVIMRLTDTIEQLRVELEELHKAYEIAQQQLAHSARQDELPDE